MRPYACSNCSQLSYTKSPWFEVVGPWLTFPLGIIFFLLIFLFPIWGIFGVVAFFVLQIILSNRYRKKFPLKPISQKRVLLSKTWFYLICLFILFGVIYSIVVEFN
jgi:positive regulator of sigma E activity